MFIHVIFKASLCFNFVVSTPFIKIFFLGSNVEKSVCIIIDFNRFAKIINLVQVTTNHSVFQFYFYSK